MAWGWLIGIAGEFVKDWRQGRESKRKVREAVTENKVRLAQSEQSHNAAWEMAALEGRDTLLRRASFAMLSAPFLWALFDPAGVSEYFTVALVALPDWYVQAYMGVLAAVWGLAELRSRIGK